MLSHLPKEKFIEKMFNAALKEKISQFARRYDPQVVFAVWAEVMTNREDKGHFDQWEWKPTMTITEALDYLDCCCDSIETMIQERLIKEK